MMRVLNVDMSFNWKWRMDADYPQKNGLKAFSCFACGGGSTMGYKLAGFDVIGHNDIDPRMIELYKANHHPRISITCDIRAMIEANDLPQELFELDVLDGSPPCSTFSMAGAREDGWGKEKVFREGQAMQTLDDLFFEFIALAKKLQPKVVISENVKGMLFGNAQKYVKRIFDEFDKAGYETQLFCLNGSTMGVPQARERVFFLSRRKDLNLPKIALSFTEKAIRFGDVKAGVGREITAKSILEAKPFIRYGEKNLSHAKKRSVNKDECFGVLLAWDQFTPMTITSAGKFIRMPEFVEFSEEDFRNVGSFPQDYDFGKETAQYVVGMSVPPLFLANISTQIKLQWFDKLG